eukprot:15366783-Ditylum_brightwellii.AAC.1
MKIEIKLLQKEIQSNYIKAICHITKCFIVNNNSSHLVDNTVAVLIDSHREHLFVHTDLTKQTFNALYKSTYLLDQFPPPVPPLQQISRDRARERRENNVAMQDAKDGSFFASQPSQHQCWTQPSITKFDDIFINLAPLCRAMEAVFTTSWSQYIKQAKKNETALKLQKLTTEHLSTTATEATQMEIENEISVNQTHLNELIKKQAQSETKLLKKEMQSLRDTITALKLDLQPKSPQRGRSGASEQKENRDLSSKSSAQHSKKGGKKKRGHQGASANNATKDKGKGERSTFNSKSGGKAKSSNKGHSKSPKQSNQK